MATAVIGFRVVTLADGKPLSRRYAARAAAEEFAALAQKEFPGAYVQTVYGQESAPPGRGKINKARQHGFPS